MKHINYRKSVIAVLAAAAALLLLSACSGVIGGDTVVRISVPGMTGGSVGRYISSDATNGYVVVLQKDKVYSLNNFDNRAYNYLINGQVYITNLPVGDYIFGVALMGVSDDNYGLAIKEVSIKKGFNDVVIEVGPGITTFNVGGIGNIDNPFIPDGFTAEFATDTMILDYGRSGAETIDISFTFGSVGINPAITAVTGFEAGGINAGNPIPDVNPSPSFLSSTVPIEASGIRIDIVDSDGGTFTYTIILK